MEFHWFATRGRYITDGAVTHERKKYLEGESGIEVSIYIYIYIYRTPILNVSNRIPLLRNICTRAPTQKVVFTSTVRTSVFP